MRYNYNRHENKSPIGINMNQSNEKNTVNHIPKEAFDWYDEYAHGGMDRRTFMNKLSTLAAVGYSMTFLTSALMPNYALAEQVSLMMKILRQAMNSLTLLMVMARAKAIWSNPTKKKPIIQLF